MVLSRAPCKGKGISAQGIVNGVNNTLGPPMSRVLKVSRPVRAERRDRGNAPSTHMADYRRMVCVGGTMSTWGLRPLAPTGGLSGNGMRWWSDEHMGITRPIYVHLISCFS